MYRYALFFLLFNTFQASAQYGKLELTVQTNFANPHDQAYNTDCYRMVITHQADTIRDEEIGDIFLFDDPFTMDSLQPGKGYKVRFYRCGETEYTYQQSFQLGADSLTRLWVNFYTSEGFDSLNPQTRNTYVSDWTVVEMTASYVNNRWFEPASILTSSALIRMSMGTWAPLSKHFGFVVGAGLSLTHSAISKDTGFFHVPTYNKLYEYSNYFDMYWEGRLRLSSGNQQERKNCGVLFDLGAAYHIPITYRHVARYEGMKKMVKTGIHQFTDVRLFANLGFDPVLVYIEYRPFNFIVGKYPELPAINFGVKVSLHYE